MTWGVDQLRLPHVNSVLLPYKLFYLALFSGLSSLSPFLPVFFRMRGMNAAQIGFLGFLWPVMNIPTVPFWSALAEQLGQKKAILLLTTLGSAAIRFLYVLPPSFATMIPLVVLANSLGGVPQVLADAFTMDHLEDKTDYGKQRMWGAVGWGLGAPLAGAIVTATTIESAFYLQVAFMVVAAIIATQFSFKDQSQSEPGPHVLEAVSDDSDTDVEAQIETLAEDTLNADARSALLPSPNGKRRRAGSRSPALRSPLGGAPSSFKSEESSYAPPTEAIREETRPDHAIHVSLTADRAAGQNPLAVPPPSRSTEPTPPNTRPTEPPLLTSLGPLFRDPGVWSFFLIYILMGMAMGTIEGFLPLRLNELGGSPTLIGLTLTFTCIAEVPMMWYSGALIRAVGVRGVLYTALACYVARFAYYSLLKQPWLVLPIELLHGVTFGCAWTAGTVHAGRIAPPGLEATMQALFTGAYFGVGDGLGMLLGGFMYDWYGAVILFRSCGALVAGGALLFVMSQRWFPLERAEGEEGTI